MPYFRVTRLSADFVRVIVSPEMQKRLSPDVAAFRVTVLSSESRARSLVLFARFLGKNRKIAEGDWMTTGFSRRLADELRVENTRRVCVYDSEDDHFHPTAVSPNVFETWTASLGVLGWRDLESQFQLFAETTTGNLVLVAVNVANCRSRSVSPSELPNSPDST